MKKTLDFQIDQAFVEEMFYTQKGCCALSGIEFSLKTERKGRRFNPMSPSLDRIDSSCGYTKENTRLILTALNLAFNEYGEELVSDIFKKYFEHKKKFLSI